MATAAKKTATKPQQPAAAAPTPPALDSGTASATEPITSAITDLGTAQNLPEADGGWAHHYADPAYADRTIQNFRDKGEGFRVMRIVVCDGALAKAPVKPNELPDD